MKMLPTFGAGAVAGPSVGPIWSEPCALPEASSKAVLGFAEKALRALEKELDLNEN